LLWNDPALNIDWQLAGEPLLSGKDSKGLPLSAAEVYA
jgi:dTDP-4-dehydrorhamnose 3,5-epimerase